MNNTKIDSITIQDSATISTVEISNIESFGITSNNLNVEEILGMTKPEENIESLISWEHISETDEIEISIHIGLLTGIIFGTLIAFICFHILYRKYRNPICTGISRLNCGDCDKNLLCKRQNKSTINYDDDCIYYESPEALFDNWEPTPANDVTITEDYSTVYESHQENTEDDYCTHPVDEINEN